VLLIFSHYGFSQNWKVASSSITFKIKHAFGSTAEGSFKGLTSSIFFDTNQLLKTSMIASLEARTIDTGLGLRDKTLRGAKYFDVEKCPKIEMTCTQAERGAKANEYIGTFEVTMRNIK
jgi:polyisoprenoid-binding protein YceI